MNVVVFCYQHLHQCFALQQPHNHSAFQCLSAIHPPGLKLTHGTISILRSTQTKPTEEESSPTQLAAVQASRSKAEASIASRLCFTWRLTLTSTSAYHKDTKSHFQHRSPRCISCDRVNLWKFLQLILVRELFIHIPLVSSQLVMNMEWRVVSS